MAATAQPRTSPGCNHAVFLMLAVALCTLGPVRTSNPLSPAAAPAADCAGKGKAGSNCSELNVKELDEKVCDESSCKYGGVCKEEGESWKCVCQLQCHTNYIPVCGSNGDTYQNECFLRRAACKHQKDITVVARGSCYSDNGSGSGEGEYEGSGTDIHRKHSKCGVCKYRAECDEDAENVGCVCNIDCSGYSFNPVCASDGSSYNNPCFVREASCLRQEQIDIRHLGHCSDSDDSNLLGKKDDGMQYRPDVKDASDQREDIYIGNHIPCSDSFSSYCIHGKCEFIYSTQKASCRCESGYTGQHCEKTDFSILYVVPSRQKFTHVLIAAIIGAVQIAIIVAIVMCITRKCPQNNRGRRQKQNLGHFTSDTSSRMTDPKTGSMDHRAAQEIDKIHPNRQSSITDDEEEQDAAFTIVRVLDKVATIVDSVQASQKRIEQHHREMEDAIKTIQIDILKLAQAHSNTGYTVNRLLEKTRKVSARVKEVRARVEKQNVNVQKVETKQEEMLRKNKFRVVIYQEDIQCPSTLTIVKDRTQGESTEDAFCPPDDLSSDEEYYIEESRTARLKKLGMRRINNIKKAFSRENLQKTRQNFGKKVDRLRTRIVTPERRERIRQSGERLRQTGIRFKKNIANVAPTKDNLKKYRKTKEQPGVEDQQGTQESGTETATESREAEPATEEISYTEVITKVKKDKGDGSKNLSQADEKVMIPPEKNMIKPETKEDALLLDLKQPA